MSSFKDQGRDLRGSTDFSRAESDPLRGYALESSGWLHELARAEIHPDAEQLLQLGRAFDPQQLIEESAINFLSELRDHFSTYIRIFNGYSEGGGRFQGVKLYSVAQTAADFMVFRNQVKLVASCSAHGVISLAFTHHLRGALGAEAQFAGNSAAAMSTSGNAAMPGMPQHSQVQELLAQIGPFRDVSWTYQGEKVTPEQVARFYFAEFVRATRETRKSRASNQLLLDQIKALLHEKGLDL